MKTFGWLLIFACLLVGNSCQEREPASATVPFTLDHNRMLIDAEIQVADGIWSPVKLWVDTGNPDFFMTEALARDLGIDLPEASEIPENGQIEVSPPEHVRIGDLELDFSGVRAVVIYQPFWLFTTMRNDANLPASVLKNYYVVFDYPEKEFTVARPGTHQPKGVRVPAGVHPQTGIPQIDAVVDEDSLSFALDIGASYSFASTGVFEKLSASHPDWPTLTGAIGCANIWGWIPLEATWPMIRVPEIRCESARLTNAGVVCPPPFSPGGPGMMEWYSQKTARPVDGFLGPNVFLNCRLTIDYTAGAVYLEMGPSADATDTDVVGVTIRPEADGNYTVVGVAEKDGKPVVDGLEPGDVLARIGDFVVKGSTMGPVVDALRGKPGDVITITIERGGKSLTVDAAVRRHLSPAPGFSYQNNSYGASLPCPCLESTLAFDVSSAEHIILRPEIILEDPERFWREDEAYQLVGLWHEATHQPPDMDKWRESIERLAKLSPSERESHSQLEAVRNAAADEQSFIEQAVPFLCEWLPPDADLSTTLYFTTEMMSAGFQQRGNVVIHALNADLTNLFVHEVFHRGYTYIYRKYVSSEMETDPRRLMYLSLQNEGMATYVAYRAREIFPHVGEVGRSLIATDYDLFEKPDEVARLLDELCTLHQEAGGLTADELRTRSWTIGIQGRANYVVGAYMAQTIENNFGREALVETIKNGPQSFVAAYNRVAGPRKQFPAL